MRETKTLAIIPARGGSKRLPKKNNLELGGKPLICWTIEHAINSDLFEDILVSSDDKEILSLAKKYNIIVEDRNYKLATDSARVLDVCNDILTRYIHFDQICVLYPTSPLRNKEDIQAVLNLLDPPRCNFALAVTGYDFPPHQALIKKNDFFVPKWPEMIQKRESETGKMFVDNGSTYACTIENFLSEGTFYGKNLKGYEMPKIRSVDLDTIEDWDYLNYLFQKIN